MSEKVNTVKKTQVKALVEWRNNDVIKYVESNNS